jgi:hypothetical protein
MKTQEEIEQLAENFYSPTTTDLICSPKLVRDAYVRGYTQCQEDMGEKKYTEEQILFAFVHGGTKAEENKDAKKLAENFKDVMKILNREE